MLKYNILVTGCGGDIGQSIGKILISNSLVKNVIGCDVHPKHPGEFIFNECFVVDKCTSPEYFNQLRQIIKKRDIKILIPCSEPELRMYNMKKVEGEFPNVTLIVPNKKAMDIGFDKLETFRFFRSHLLPFPETVLLKDISKPNFPCIIKCRYGAGGKSLMIANNLYDLEYAVNNDKDYIYQEYLQPADCEHTCGLFRSQKGDIRNIIFRRILHGDYTSYGEVVRDDQISLMLENIANLLKLEGSINVQLINTKQGPRVFEINPRFSSTVLFRHLLGFKDLQWAIRDKLGQNIGPYESPKAGTKFYKGFMEYVKD